MRQAIALSNLGAIAAGAATWTLPPPPGGGDSDPARLGDRDGLAISLHNLARTEIKRGRAAEAGGLLAESLEQALALGYREVIANCLQGCAELAAGEGELERPRGSGHVPGDLRRDRRPARRGDG